MGIPDPTAFCAVHTGLRIVNASQSIAGRGWSQGAGRSMGLYQDWVLPRLIHMSMRQPVFAEYRRRVVGAAEGRVLEVGVGSGLNLPFYARGAGRVIGLDPSTGLLSMSRQVRGTGGPPALLNASAEAIPLDDRSIDTVVTTWTLCTIPDVGAALGEMRRVLKPHGRLLFVEHGRAPDTGVSRWQDRLTPLWRCIGGGCHLNRPIADLITGAGFRIQRIETGYMTGPKLMTFMYEGMARPA